MYGKNTGMINTVDANAYPDLAEDRAKSTL